MARIRTIKPEFPQSESMGNVSRDARLTFLQLWTIADDEGRLRGNSRMLASLLFPYDDDAPSLIDSWLLELENENCIIRFKYEGQSYIQICKWLIHQKIDKPSKSKIPSFESIREDSRGVVVGSRIKDQGSRIEGSKDQRIEGSDKSDAEHKLDDVDRVFAHWQSVMNSPRSVLDANRKKLISSALKNYSIDDIFSAINGCAKSPHHMGENEQRTVYNGLNLILRNAEKIDQFIKLNAGKARSQNESIAQINARITAEVLGKSFDDGKTIDMETGDKGHGNE